MGEITKEDGSKITSQSGIDLEIRNFFKDLYAESGHQVNSPDELKNFMPANFDPPNLTNSQADLLESEITHASRNVSTHG